MRNWWRSGVLLALCCVVFACGPGRPASDPGRPARDAGQNATPPPVISLEQLAGSVGQSVRVRGIAVRAKWGPLLQLDDGAGVYLNGVPDWRDTEIGTTLLYAGRLRMETISPQEEGEPLRQSFGPGEVHFLDECVRLDE